MENAAKALLIAGSVLLAVLIISFGLYIFNRFSTSTGKIVSEIEKNKIVQFNTQFYKYEGTELNAHDVVSIANLAKENNKYNGIENESGSGKNSKYITVSVMEFEHFEKQSEEKYLDFVKENSYQVVNGNITENIKKFYCVSIENNKDGRVNYIKIIAKN